MYHNRGVIMNRKNIPLTELAQSLNKDLNKLQGLLEQLSLELKRLNLEHKWMMDSNQRNS